MFVRSWSEMLRERLHGGWTAIYELKSAGSYGIHSDRITAGIESTLRDLSRHFVERETTSGNPSR